MMHDRHDDEETQKQQASITPSLVKEAATKQLAQPLQH
jgi:hypothetical protein